MKSKRHNKTQAFVAMSFDESLKEIFDKFISKAIIDSGYRPLIMYTKEFNDSIIDKTIGEIINSKFVIADFTYIIRNVYFEAGFAYGLGLQVIYTCRQTDKKKIQFDIQHNNFIFWETGDELYDRLKNRIIASIL